MLVHDVINLLYYEHGKNKQKYFLPNLNILGTLKSVLFKQLSVIGVLRTLSSICNGTFYELANG